MQIQERIRQLETKERCEAPNNPPINEKKSTARDDLLRTRMDEFEQAVEEMRENGRERDEKLKLTVNQLGNTLAHHLEQQQQQLAAVFSGKPHAHSPASESFEDIKGDIEEMEENVIDGELMTKCEKRSLEAPLTQKKDKLQKRK